MIRPLYRAASQQSVSRGANGHAGLWFDKFCDRWRVSGGSWTMSADDGGNPKLDWIRSIASDRAIGDERQIHEHALRLVRLVATRGGRVAVFKTESRFVTGLGRSHPVENGFVWHPTLGAPYLPGSSIKGLVRSWVREHAEPRPVASTVNQLLGSQGKVGDVCFLDAVPTGIVQLEADMMTPHYAGWNANEPPGDWCAPNPIPFLTTAPGARFLFSVVPRRVASTAALDALFGWLEDALAWTGGGAKVAVGYGRFRLDEGSTAEWMRRPDDEKQRRRDLQARKEAMATPEGRWRLQLEELNERQTLEQVRIRLEEQPIENPLERAAFAKAVVATGLVDHWRRGKLRDPKTGVGAKKLKERARLVDGALASSDPSEEK